MRKSFEVMKRTLAGVLLSTVALAALTGVASAQTPSFAPPPAQPSTFMLGINFSPPATGAGDLFCITGSTARLTKVKTIRINGTSTSTAATPVFNLIKRSTADTGGTSTTPVGVPIDSQQVVTTATATMKAYTVVPTPGTAVGTISSQFLTLNLATVGPTDDLAWNWTPPNLNSDVRLRSAAESLCINAPSTLGTTPSLSVEITWTEQ